MDTWRETNGKVESLRQDLNKHCGSVRTVPVLNKKQCTDVEQGWMQKNEGVLDSHKQR